MANRFDLICQEDNSELNQYPIILMNYTQKNINRKSSLKEQNKQSDDEFIPEQISKPKDFLKTKPKDNPLPTENQGQKKRRGRPPKNQIERIDKKPRKYERGHLLGNSDDGFNLRKQRENGPFRTQKSTNGIKITGLFTDIKTNEILYKVEENNQSRLQSRSWVINRSKRALIQFYQSCIVVSPQKTDLVHVKDDL